MPILLEASSLLFKWGFQDGDIISETDALDLVEADWTKLFEKYRKFYHCLLTELVERFLLPLIRVDFPNAEIIQFQTIHNPVRLRNPAQYEGHLDSISVHVSDSQILEVLRDMEGRLA